MPPKKDKKTPVHGRTRVTTPRAHTRQTPPHIRAVASETTPVSPSISWYTGGYGMGVRAINAARSYFQTPTRTQRSLSNLHASVGNNMDIENPHGTPYNSPYLMRTPTSITRSSGSTPLSSPRSGNRGIHYEVFINANGEEEIFGVPSPNVNPRPTKKQRRMARGESGYQGMNTLAAQFDTENPDGQTQYGEDESTQMDISDVENILDPTEFFGMNRGEEQPSKGKEKEKEKEEVTPKKFMEENSARARLSTGDLLNARRKNVLELIADQLPEEHRDKAVEIAQRVLHQIPKDALQVAYLPLLASGDMQAILDLDGRRLMGNLQKFWNDIDPKADYSTKKNMPTEAGRFTTASENIEAHTTYRKGLQWLQKLKGFHQELQNNGYLQTFMNHHKSIIGYGTIVPSTYLAIKSYLEGFTGDEEVKESLIRQIDLKAGEELYNEMEKEEHTSSSTLNPVVGKDASSGNIEKEMFSCENPHSESSPATSSINPFSLQEQQSLGTQTPDGQIEMGVESCIPPAAAIPEEVTPSPFAASSIITTPPSSIHNPTPSVSPSANFVPSGHIDTSGNLKWNTSLPKKTEEEAVNPLPPTQVPISLLGKEELGEQIMSLREKNPAEFGTDEERANMGKGALNLGVGGVPKTYPLGKEDKDLYFVRGIKKKSSDLSKPDKQVSVWASTMGTRGQKLKNSNKAVWAYHHAGESESKWERLYGESYIKPGSKYDKAPYEAWDPRKGLSTIESENKLYNMLLQLNQHPFPAK